MSTVASADQVINGCTIVSNPTPTNFTDCPGANLANISIDLNLSYANLQNADLHFTMADGSNFTDADLRGANLTGLYTVDANMTGVHVGGANMTDDIFDEYAYATSPAGAYVDVTSNYAFDGGIPGATFDGCTFSSGVFPVGTTYGQCSLTDTYGGVATDQGSFVDVMKTPSMLTAQPAVVSTAPTPTLYAFTMTATLSFDNNNSNLSGPIVGQPVIFTTGSSSCTGTTDGSGTATCNVLLNPTALASVIEEDGYLASYAGNSWIFGVSGDNNPGLVYAPPLPCGPPLGASCPPPP
jgi:hypothetical protein